MYYFVVNHFRKQNNILWQNIRGSASISIVWFGFSPSPSNLPTHACLTIKIMNNYNYQKTTCFFIFWAFMHIPCRVNRIIIRFPFSTTDIWWKNINSLQSSLRRMAKRNVKLIHFPATVRLTPTNKYKKQIFSSSFFISVLLENEQTFSRWGLQSD